MKTRAVASPAASLDELVTRRYPLEQINEACEALAHGEITGRAVVEL